MDQTNAVRTIVLAPLFLIFAALSLSAAHAGTGSQQTANSAQSAKADYETMVPILEDGEWREEFDRICAQTNSATSLTKAELEQLINDTEELLGNLSAIKDPWTKVYIFRLNKCRDFFQFTLDWQNLNRGGDAP